MLDFKSITPRSPENTVIKLNISASLRHILTRATLNRTVIKFVVKKDSFDSVDDVKVKRWMPRLPLSAGPPGRFREVVLLFVLLACFNEDVLLGKEQLQSDGLKMHSFRVELDVRIEDESWASLSMLSAACWYAHILYLIIQFSGKRNTWQPLPEGNLTTHNAALKVKKTSVEPFFFFNLNEDIPVRKDTAPLYILNKHKKKDYQIYNVLIFSL